MRTSFIASSVATAVAAFLSGSAFAAPSADPKVEDWFFFGAEVGPSKVSPDSGVRESEKSGYSIMGKLGYSHYWQDIVGDAFIGFMYHSVNGDDVYNPAPDSRVKVITRASFFELSPRYRLTPHWQIGPVVHGVFGTDVSFSEQNVEDSSVAILGGLRLNYEGGNEEWRWRIGVQASKDLNVGNRGVTIYAVNVEFGLPFEEEATRVAEPKPEPAPVPPPPPARPVAPKFAEVTPQKEVKIYLGEAVLRFKTAKADLRPSSREILAKVAAYLKKNDSAWKTMRVEGHSDKRGRLAFNQTLSEKRADAVAKELVRLGISRTKLKTEGFGPSRPIDPAEDLEAYALNRRVELWLDGVTDPEAITRDLNLLGPQ